MRRKPRATGKPRKSSYEMFPLRRHLARFEFDRRGFLRSITPQTHILEVGAAGGRLTDHILRHSAVDPANYVLMDLDYGSRNPSFTLKRKVYAAKRQGLKQVSGDLFHPPFRKRELFDKIIIPEALLPLKFVRESPEMHQVIRRLFGREANPLELANIFDRMLGTWWVVKHYFPLLKKGGELYLSDLHYPWIQEVLEMPREEVPTKPLLFFRTFMDHFRQTGRARFEVRNNALYLVRLK